MLPAKKAITERPAQQRGQGRALGCPRSITAPWHGGALCLSFPICRRGLAAGAGGRYRQLGPWHRGEDRSWSSQESRFIFQFKIQSGFAPTAGAGSRDE